MNQGESTGIIRPQPSLAAEELLNSRPQIWNGQFWESRWYEQFKAEMGCGELLSISQPSVILSGQRNLLEAGADGVSTNTLGAIPSGMRQYNAEHLCVQANHESAQLARRVVDEWKSFNRRCVVLGVMGQSHAAQFDVRLQDSYVQAKALLQGGVDMLHLERCQSLAGAKSGLEAIRILEMESGQHIPVMVTAELQATGVMLDGSSHLKLLEASLDNNLVVFGVTGLSDLREPLRELRRTHIAIAALPDAFAVASEHGYLDSPISLAEQVADLVLHEEVAVVGVGLGGTPEYVRAIARVLGRAVN